MMEMVTVTGNTYPVRDKIKALGGRWNADAKGWDVPRIKEAEVRALIGAVPVAAIGKCSKCSGVCKASYTVCFNCRPAPRKCKQCGATPDRRGWPRIYKNGICSDCYRDEREEAEMGW